MAAGWHYVRNGQQLGPVSSDDLRQLADSGQLSADDLVWKEGLTEWLPARRVKGLAFAAARPAAQAATAVAEADSVPDRAPDPAGDAPSGAGEEIPMAQDDSPAPLQPAPAPMAVDYYSPRGAPEAGVTPQAVEMLRQTKPWVRLISVVIFVGAGLMVCGGIVIAAAAAMAPRGAAAGVGLLMFLLYAAMAALYIAPGVFLSRYASHIGRLMTSHSARDLESALQAQKSFWKFVGIMTAIVLCVYAIIFIIAILIGALGRSF